jgi:hypothetical protein
MVLGLVGADRQNQLTAAFRTFTLLHSLSVEPRRPMATSGIVELSSL